ncbi:MAG: YqcC family protein [Planctomycetes bacterium]|nr:YqcC family protein [Planctomycetota bacterium]
MTPLAQRALEKIDAIEAELRRLGRWQATPLEPGAYEFKAAFGADTMTFSQWLQFILVPRVREIAAGGGEFPSRSAVGAYALRELDGDYAAADLVRHLCDFDALFEATEEFLELERPAPRPEPAPNTQKASPVKPQKEAAPAQGLSPDAAKKLAELRDVKALALEEEIRERLGCEIKLDVEWNGFVSIAGKDALRVLEQLESSQWLNLHYLLDSIAKSCPLADRVKRIRWEPTQDPAKRVAYGFCDTIVLHIDPRDWDGFLSISELERLLPAMVHGLDGSKAPVTTLTPPPELEFGAALTRYRDEILPTERARLRGLTSASLTVEATWSTLAGNAEAARWLPIWGLQRVIGALEALPDEPELREALGRAFERIELRFCDTPEKKECRVADSALTLTIAPQHGEKGCYYEQEIREVIEDALGLPWREQIGRLRESAEEWEKRLQEQLKVPVRYEIDWNAFTTHTDRGTIQRGLYTVGEFGIDALYYAVSGLAEKSEDLRRQVAERIRLLRLRAAATAAAKGLAVDGNALVLTLSVHSDPKGYLTLQELTQRLPRALERMPALPLPEDEEAKAAAERERLASLAREDRVHVAAEPPVATPAEEEPADEEELDHNAEGDFYEAVQAMPEDGDREAFDALRQTIVGQVLPGCSVQLTQLYRRTIPIEVDWSTMPKSSVMLGQFINNALAPTLGLMATLSFDPKAGERLRKELIKVVLGTMVGDRVLCAFEEGVLELRFPMAPLPPSQTEVGVLVAAANAALASSGAVRKPKEPAKTPRAEAAKRAKPTTKASTTKTKSAGKPKAAAKSPPKPPTKGASKPKKK